MSYRYESEKYRLFTEDGVKDLMGIKDAAMGLIETAGAFRAVELLEKTSHPDTFFFCAALDYLVEKGHLIELTRPNCMSQFQCYTTPQVD